MDNKLTSVVTSEAAQETGGLAASYLRFCAANLGQLGQYIERQDLTSVSRIAHIFTGNAGRIGLTELSSLGRQLEEYCLGSDWNAIDAIYRAIADTVQKLCDGKPVRVHIEPGGNGSARTFNVKRLK